MNAGLPLATMAVNISAMEFRDDNFPGKRVRNPEGYGFDPGGLELELTRAF